ncbi:MAG: hypothetical protein ACLQDY_12855 [Streptosporangiaceae bacterium]
MKEERRIAALARIQKQADDRAAWKSGGGLFRNSILLANLGVVVKDGDVWTMPVLQRPSRIGSLIGAVAEVTDGTRVHRVGAAVAGTVLLGPVGALPGLSRKSKATAFVVFADGTLHEHKLDGNAAVRQAQAEAVRFNTLAAEGNQEITSRRDE